MYTREENFLIFGFAVPLPQGKKENLQLAEARPRQKKKVARKKKRESRLKRYNCSRLGADYFCRELNFQHVMTTENIIKFVALGTSVTIDCRKISYNGLVNLANAAKMSGAKVTLTNIIFTFEATMEVVRIAPTQFCLDFTSQHLGED